ncbi:MAG TPA: bifunctional DNA primase/polymerase [Actinomycetes bacterium]
MRRWISNGLLRSALEYAERGIPVFPCHHPANHWAPGRWSNLDCSCQQLGCPHPGAHPLSPRWREEATTDPLRVERCWGRHPRANVGLVTGVVFDVLDVPGTAGALGIPQSTTPAGPAAITGDGRHHFFVAPTGLGDTAVPGGDAPGPRGRLHWHGRGGYVLAAPSRHPGGATTRWLRGLDRPLPEVSPPAPAPIMAVASGAPAILS